MNNEEFNFLENNFKIFEKKCKRGMDTNHITFIKKFGKFFEVKTENNINNNQFTSQFFINAIKNKSLTILENDYTLFTNILHTSKIGKNITKKEIVSNKELMILESKNYNLKNENLFYISNGDKVIYEMQLIKKSENNKEYTYKIINEKIIN